MVEIQVRENSSKLREETRKASRNASLGGVWIPGTAYVKVWRHKTA
jgi:hypothetical protein